MHTPLDSRPAAVAKRAVMWLNEDRVLYIGLLGAPAVRTLGAFSIYVSITQPHRLSIDGGPWQTSALSVVLPHVPHRIACDERMICNLLVESETVTQAGLPPFLRDARGAVDAPAVLARMRAALGAFRDGGQTQYAHTADFDLAFFGQALPRRPIDARIGKVLARVKSDPNEPHPAAACAASIHVSVSRFLHLFKAEVGMPFRSFRTWQRARSVLYFVTHTSKLTTIALDVGYPDSTHFSHSIRHVFGLTPKSIFAGCRQLALYRGRAAA
jgi:AraC-like DNA-binding protein